jgi:hypothetical protein
MQCPRCQQDNPTRQNFCGECGTPLQHSSVDQTKDRIPLSLFRERLSPENHEAEPLESTRRFQRLRSGTLIPKLLGILIGVALTAVVVSLAGLHTKQPHSGGPDDSVSPSVGPARTKSVSPRDADRLTPRQRETSHPSDVTGTVSREPGTTSKEATTSPRKTGTPPRGASTPANETGAPPKAGTSQGASGGRPRLSATARPSPSAPAPSNQVASAPSPEAATPKATPPFGSSHAELVRQPVARGWGDSYAVRLLDSAGRPLVVAAVLLVAHMADGTVENIAMGALPEPGTYRGTVPTGRSTPVDLRVRVSAGDNTFVEIPVRP